MAYANPTPANTEVTPMGVDDVRSTVAKMIEEAIGFIDGDVSKDRERATEYYQGKPFGNEEENRSQFVLTEVRDVVTALMPSMLEVLFGGERVAEFAPRHEEDVPAADQATEFICDIVMQEDNDGFLHTHSVLKDGFVRKLGIFKWWWDDSAGTTGHVLENADEQQLQDLYADDSITITNVTRSPLGGFRAEYTREKPGLARFEAIPPEEFLFTRSARSLGAAICVTHRTEKTRSELIAMGIDAKVIEEHGAHDSSLADHPEEVARNPLGGGRLGTEDSDPATARYLYCESYPYLDVDGDGIAELRKVCTLGPGHYVVNGDGQGEPVALRPFALYCPDPEPHAILGQCPADATMDLQLAGSSVMRAALDSLALSIFPQKAYMEGEVNEQDIMSTEVSHPIRTTRPPNEVLQEFKHEFTGVHALPILDKFESIKENRTGISKAAAGLNADALQSSTKAAVAATVTAKQQHIKLLAKIFVETCMKPLLKGLLQLVCEHQPYERIVRLRSGWVPIDPRSWDASMDVRVNVGLGGGLPQERVEMLTLVAAKQEQIMQLLGADNPLVSLSQLRNTYARILELQGFRDVESFFKPVDPNWKPPQQQPQPDPNMVIAQAEVAKAQAEVAKKQADIAAKGEELKLEMAAKQQELALKARELDLREQEMVLADARAREQMIAEIDLKARELEMKYQGQVDEAYIKADAEREREAMRLDQPPRKRKVTTKRDPETGALTAESEEVSEG